MSNLRKLISISRPRFWLYVLGTFMLGMVAAGKLFDHDLFTITVLFGLAIFFSLPSNLFIYGVNDMFDYDTDRHNQKKIAYEKLLRPEERKYLRWWIVCLILPFIPLGWYLDARTLLSLGIFMFTGYFYSALPIRAKARPPLDVLFSSVIYVSPSLVGYFAAGGKAIDVLLLLGGLLWAMAMQTYSAVPDIEADQKAGVSTLATKLGRVPSLYFCLFSYLTAAFIGSFYVGFLAIALGIVYASIVWFTMKKPEKLFTYYTYFPLINSASGALLFFYIFLRSL